MAKIKKPFLFSLCLAPIAFIAGVLVALYQLDIYSDELFAEAVSQLGSTDALVVLSGVQAIGYAMFCGFFGYILAEKVGLWKPIVLAKKSFIITLLLSLVGGVIFSLDHFTFGNVIDGIQSANLGSLTICGFAASILYGGIIEELMLRLFFMSLLSFVLWKLFYRKYDYKSIPACVFIVANVISALMFAAGHLPATVALFGELSALLIIRCFLINGGFGILFGWIYRRYGIVYAMTCHALLHAVSKLIWLVFA